jgi:hypothetical protein
MRKQNKLRSGFERRRLIYGKAEFVCKTAEGGKDAAGNNIGETYFPEYKSKYRLTTNYNPAADYRNGNGYILRGPEFLIWTEYIPALSCAEDIIPAAF